MNKEDYFSLKADYIHKRLITDISINPNEADELLDELTKSNRFKEDYAFRASVETAKVYIYLDKGKPLEVINRSKSLIEIAIVLKEWELLSIDYNMVANAYFLLGMYEKAVEYYYSAINNEKEHGLKNIIVSVYANLGRIFLNLNLFEKAVEYLRPALEGYKYADLRYFRLKEKKIHILSDILTATTLLDNPDVDEIESINAELTELSKQDLKPDIAYSCYLGLMFYFFWKKDYDEAKKVYIKALEKTEDNSIYKLVVIYTYIECCDKNGLDMKYFEGELFDLSNLGRNEYPINEPIIYHYLKKYYTAMGDLEKAETVRVEYEKFLDNIFVDSQKKQAESVQIVENLLKHSKNEQLDEDKNREFKLVAEEAIRNKDELQKTYDRFKMIHEIGIKLTSSTNLNEVVNLIYKNIRENIPADAFMFMAAEPENNQLRSLLCYKEGELSPGFTISFANKESALVKCCLNNKLVTTDDDDFKPLFGKFEDEDSDEEVAKSALFIPLSIGDKVIGAYSVQSISEKAYKAEDLDFLRELRPYLVIALNNAVHSRKLENEIERNKEIQHKLKEANGMLSKMAGIDALTQISNRREFAEKFQKLRRDAYRANESVSVFMFDIDDFKKYNDTYGHFEGDEALKKVATIINRNIIQNNGIAARFGGEEFISACTGLTTEENYNLGQKIRKEIYDLDIKNEQTKLGILSISVGIAISIPDEIVTKSEIMSLADEMLYEAKKTGKNKVVMKVLG